MSSESSSWSTLPYHENVVVKNDLCKLDVAKPEILKPCQIKIANDLTFTDRLLPETSCKFFEHERFSKSYFVDLHNRVRAFGVHNYKGA